MSCTWPHFQAIPDDFKWSKKLRSLQLDPKVISFDSFYYNQDVILGAIAYLEDYTKQQDRDRRELEAKTIQQERREAECLKQERLEVERVERESLEVERAKKPRLEAQQRESERLRMEEGQREFEFNNELQNRITKSRTGLPLSPQARLHSGPPLLEHEKN